MARRDVAIERIGRNAGKGRYPSCAGEENVRTHIAGWFRNCKLQNEMFNPYPTNVENRVSS